MKNKIVPTSFGAAIKLDTKLLLWSVNKIVTYSLHGFAILYSRLACIITLYY